MRIDPTAWGFPSYEQYLSAAPPNFTQGPQWFANASQRERDDYLAALQQATNTINGSGLFDTALQAGYGVDPIPGENYFSGGPQSMSEGGYNSSIRRHIQQLSPSLDPFGERSLNPLTPIAGVMTGQAIGSIFGPWLGGGASPGGLLGIDALPVTASSPALAGMAGGLAGGLGGGALQFAGEAAPEMGGYGIFSDLLGRGWDIYRTISDAWQGQDQGPQIGPTTGDPALDLMLDQGLEEIATQGEIATPTSPTAPIAEAQLGEMGEVLSEPAPPTNNDPADWLKYLTLLGLIPGSTGGEDNGTPGILALTGVPNWGNPNYVSRGTIPNQTNPGAWRPGNPGAWRPGLTYNEQAGLLAQGIPPPQNYLPMPGLFGSRGVYGN